ncbi:MAG: response regulator [Elusimicrobia bacterium]|nr:response regulator [Elusimicrobiota bacterium]MDE2237181.1 response regulator [Elusimicrobiota bacterium]MDE2426541.1 response regulator [Elusimicrobiota bacterium]
MIEPAPRPTKVLIVDDEYSIREVLSTQLARLKYSPVTASNGVEAVAAFKSAAPDLVLMDLMMPVMDGLEACQRIRSLERKGRRVPILFLTARDSPRDKLSSALSGGDDFIIKPISLQDLRERVEAALLRAGKR